MGILPHAILSIPDSQGNTLVVPVSNFPVLPEKSQVYLYFGKKDAPDGAWIEGHEIDHYYVDNTIGVVIRMETLNETTWKAIARLCVPETTNFADLIYPNVIDFGTRFPMPSPPPNP